MLTMSVEDTGSTTRNTSRSRPITTPKQNLAIYCAKLPPTYVNSFCGAVAGVASGIVTCPLDVIKTRLQAQGSFRQTDIIRRPPTSGQLYQGLIGTARVIWKEDGVRGMYRGLGPMLLGYLPTWAVYMGVYEKSKDYYYTKMGMSCEAEPIFQERRLNADGLDQRING
jgi:solute carrier family 25 (mitochondrial folate transporter), member 32